MFLGDFGVRWWRGGCPQSRERRVVSWGGPGPGPARVGGAGGDAARSGACAGGWERPAGIAAGNSGHGGHGCDWAQLRWDEAEHGGEEASEDSEWVQHVWALGRRGRDIRIRGCGDIASIVHCRNTKGEGRRAGGRWATADGSRTRRDGRRPRVGRGTWRGRRGC